MARQEREAVSLYWGCSGLHSEVNCMQAFYHDKRYRDRARWCDTCLDNFPEREEEQ